MNEIAEILFQRIPGMLFEPFAIFGVFGLILAAILYWKRHSPLYWVIVCFDFDLSRGNRNGIFLFSNGMAG